MTLFLQLITVNAFAQTDAEYNAALDAIGDGGSYYVTTDVDGETFYLTADGNLTSEKEFAPIFVLKKMDGGGFKTYGYALDGGTGYYFSNPSSTANIDDTHLNTHKIEGFRKTWDVQVFFLNTEGKYAVRATNAAYASSSWGWVGSSFWTVKEGPMAGYSFDVNYIWELETPTDEAQVYTLLNNVISKYEDQTYDDEDGYSMNIGDEFGQHSDVESWLEFWNLLQEIYTICNESFEAETFAWVGDGPCPTIEEAQAMAAKADELYQKILDSEVPYMIPQNGYYRIYANLLYTTSKKETFADKAIAASFSADQKNKAVYATVDKKKANFLWKLTKSETGDSIMIQNAGMGTYISLSKSPTENRVIMTDDESDASYVMFDYAGLDPVEVSTDMGVSEDKDIFYIRLASQPKGEYVHQLGHGVVSEAGTIWGHAGEDTGKEMDMSFWAATHEKTNTDKGTSEWYLEYVDDSEAEELIENFEMIKNHDVLVAQNNALRAEVAEALITAKDAIKTKMITSGSQMTSPYSCDNFGVTDGQTLASGCLIDGDKGTYWHSDWQGHAPAGSPYIQIADMQDMVGDCEFYICDRNTTSGNWPAALALYGSNDPELETEQWNEIAVFNNLTTGALAENICTFYSEIPYEYVRVVATTQSFWHAAELQIYTISENPNSQFAALGEIATELEAIYNENAATADEDITLEMYQALLDAFKAFNAGMVDPTELRNALATYANLTKGVVEGDGPGLWSSTQIAEEFDDLYDEVSAYDKAGRYTAVQNHNYAVMLKAMKKSVMEQANGVKTDKWYYITFPTEEMYTDFGFDPSSPGGASKIVDDPNQWGYYVVSGVRTDEMGTDDETGEEKATGNYYLEFVGKEDVREGMSMYFANPDEIEDLDVSMFRFIEREPDAVDYTSLFSDVKENMLMALDMSTTYTKGEALITDASQLSSNASDPSEGLHIENLIDGNINTYWHSDYHKQYLEPGYIQVALNEPVSGLIQVDITRRQGASNGHIVRMYIQGSNDGEAWTNVGYLETPFTNQNESVTSAPVDLDGTYSFLRFTLTYRYGTDGGGNTEFDPFAEVTSADEYNTKWTYFHAAEFQIYPVTPDQPVSGRLQRAYTVANKVLLKDATADDLAAAASAYNIYRSDFNAKEGKSILPNSKEKADPVYAIQNKATGLFINCKGSNNANNSLETIPTFFDYKAIGYQRSLIHGWKIDGGDCSYLHSQNFDHRFVTWNATAPNSNSGLVIVEADEAYEAPEEFTFYRDIKPGKIYNWCSSVTITPEPADDCYAYTCLGRYQNDEGDFLALKEIEVIPAGEPAFYFYGDTTEYDAEDDYVEPILFTMPGEEELVVEPDTINGLIGVLGTHTLLPYQIYISASQNAPLCIGETGHTVSAPTYGVVLDMPLCPNVDPDEEYDFSICLGKAGDDSDGVKDIPTAIENISKPGNVYSMDGKLLRTGATLNSLKALGKGMYILNGVKVLVK